VCVFDVWYYEFVGGCCGDFEVDVVFDYDFLVCVVLFGEVWGDVFECFG